MLTYWVRHEHFQAARRFVETMREPYEYRQTSSSQTIKNKKFAIRTSQHYLGRGILGHLIACKAEILKNAKEKELLVPKRMNWFRLSPKFNVETLPGKMFVSEFDLNHAYWAVAFRLGFISKKTYEKFLTFKTKHFRLIALGMLAKREHIRKYDKFGVQTESKDNVDEIGQLIFRRIAFEVSNEMYRLSETLPIEFHFYWFDNIVFDTTVRKLETSYAYKFREETLETKFLPKKRILLKLGAREFSFSRTAALGTSPLSELFAKQEQVERWKERDEYA